jgi:hypothetical protein
VSLVADLSEEARAACRRAHEKLDEIAHLIGDIARDNRRRHWARVLSVRCPKCDAAPGEECAIRRPSGGRHLSRWHAADRVDHDPGDEHRGAA